MLARANSDAAARLRRSKSASAVHKRPMSIAEPFDLDTIRHQALAAATAAFARAQAQDAIEYANRCSSDLSRSKSNASRKFVTTQGNHFPPRGSSFRSMQAPKMEQGKDSQRKSQASVSHREQTTEQPSRFHPTPTSDDSLAVPHQLSKQPLVTLAENAKPSFQQKIFRSSAASSVTLQQIRKARSMYYASSIQTGSPIARPPAKYLTSRPSDGKSPGLETSPIQPPTRTLERSPLTEPRIPVTVAPNMTINEARDEYLHGFQQSSVNQKPSLFLASFKKRQDKNKDKAKSACSNKQPLTMSMKNTTMEPTLDTALSCFMPQQDLKEKRSFSGSLKHKIKKVFRRTSAKPIDLPVQHIKASRQYFDAPHLSPSSVGGTCSIPCPEETILERVRSRTSSLDKTLPSYLRSGHRSDSTGSERSARSLHSEVNALHVPASRMTSWGTTSTSDTLTQRTIKCMTVIHEATDSIGSEAERAASATASRRKSLHLPLLSSFRDPMPMHSLPEDESNPIDPKRVFSALVREMRTTKPSQKPSVLVELTSDAENGVSESSTTTVQDQDLSSSCNYNVWTSIEGNRGSSSRQSVVADSVRSRTSTVKPFGKAVRSTIRAVTPAGQHLPPYHEPTAIFADAMSMHENEHGSLPATQPDNEGCQGSSSTTKRQHTHSLHIPSASQIERRMEKSRDRWKAHLEDPEYFQFPRETDKTYDTTAFVPQTCASLSDSTKSSKKPEPHDYSVMEKDSLQLPLSLEIPKSASIEMPMSPSIYSRNTDGISINLNDSVASIDGPDKLGQSHNTGSAVVLTSESVRSYVVGTPSPERQKVAHTSRDWRAWLSHEISTMESSSREDFTINKKCRKCPRKEWSDSMYVSNPEIEDTAVVVRDYLDATAPAMYRNTSEVADTSCGVQHSNNSKENANKSTDVGATSCGEHSSFLNTHHADDVSSSGSDITTTSKVHNTPQPESAPFPRGPLLISTPNIRTSYRAGVEIHKPTLRNGQGALTAVVRCSSGNSIASRHSTSPTNKMPSQSFSEPPKLTPEGVFRSNLSPRSATETSQHMATTPLERNGIQVRRKENLMPKFLDAHKQSNPSPLNSLPRPTSHQLLSSSTPIRSSPNTNNLNVATPGTTLIKSPSSVTAAPLRPRLCIIARPISPEKRAQRSKSVLNLQAKSEFESPNKLPFFSTASPTPRPRTYVRDPALYTAPSSLNSLSLYREPSPACPIAAATLNGECYDKSATPGHRMADQFLRQRNSTIECEDRDGKWKGSKFLEREDTPAFL